MYFDKKKLSVIIAAAPGDIGKDYSKNNEDPDYGKEGLEMAASKMISAVKEDKPSKFSEALSEWCKIYKSYEDNNIKPENREEMK